MLLFYCNNSFAVVDNKGELILGEFSETDSIMIIMNNQVIMNKDYFYSQIVGHGGVYKIEKL